MSLFSFGWFRNLSAAVIVAGCGIGCVAPSSGNPGVRLQDDGRVVKVSIDGIPFAEHRASGYSRPFLFPIQDPSGAHFTRRWPQEEVAGEERDHPHHRGLWWAHGDVNGHDFWSETPKAGTTVQKGILRMESGRKAALLKTGNEWRAKDGTVVATDERTYRFHRSDPNARIVDFEIKINASNGDLRLGDTKEGSMAIRLAESMRVSQPKNQPGQGSIVMATGEKDKAAWGKRSAWCDYYGPVDGRTLGVAIFDHPDNPRHPTWWHVRDYGLFAANPFGVHDFEPGKPKTAGEMTIPAGSSATFRYRFVFHAGTTGQARIEELYRDYSK